MAMVNPDLRRMQSLSTHPRTRREESVSLEKALEMVRKGTLSATALYEQLPQEFAEVVDGLARSEYGCDWDVLEADSKRQLFVSIQEALKEQPIDEVAPADDSDAAMVSSDSREIGALSMQPLARRRESVSFERALEMVDQGKLSATALYAQLPPAMAEVVDGLARSVYDCNWDVLEADSKRQILLGIRESLRERVAAENAAAVVEAEIQRHLDERHPEQAVRYANKLVEERYAGGDAAGSWEMACRARDLAVEHLKGDHAATAQSFNNLAVLHNVRGKFDEARRLCVQALEMRCRTVGETSRDAAESLGNLGFAQAALGSLEDARESYSRALEIYRVLGLEDDPDCVIFKRQYAKLGSS